MLRFQQEGGTVVERLGYQPPSSVRPLDTTTLLPPMHVLDRGVKMLSV